VNIQPAILFPLPEKIFFLKSWNIRPPYGVLHGEDARLIQKDAFIKNQIGENIMKNAFVRILVLATLATSVSAFAATGNSPSNNAAGSSTSSQQNGCPTSKEDKKQKKEKKMQHEETDQEKDPEDDPGIQQYCEQLMQVG